jgi:iron-sulfur cluster assembly accessory protein
LFSTQLTHYSIPWEVLMDQMDQKTTILSITDNAAEKVKGLMEQEGEEDLALRVGVRPGGCSGFQYSIYFDDEINDDDEVIEAKGLKVVIDAMSVPYIMGSEFDYVDGLMGAGFAVNNPNVQGGCGCGSSFTC